MVGLCERSSGLGWITELGVKWGARFVISFRLFSKGFFPSSTVSSY